MATAPPRVAVVQDGARLHYLLPLALDRAGMLDRAFTEFYAVPGSKEAKLVELIGRMKPALATRMGQRYCKELPPKKVVHNARLLISEQFARIGAGPIENYYRRCTNIVGRWIRRVGLGEANALMGFVRNIDPKLCRFARDRGLKVVADQMIAPAHVEEAEGRIQAERWPGWEPSSPLGKVQALEEETWAACDHLTAASDYVRDGLIGQGIEPGRISVLPYPVASDWFQPRPRPRDRKPFTVGFVGTVNLRKGAPYLFETARRLPATEFRFVMVGPVALNAEMVAKHQGNVEVLGRRSRAEVARLLDEFDAFYLPSTCEGSAGSVMEAMMAGLPVVCSPNTGSVIRDGIDGFIVNYDDTERAADAFAELARDPNRRAAMGESARARAASFNVDRYSSMLAELLTRLLGQSSAPHERLP